MNSLKSKGTTLKTEHTKFDISQNKRYWEPKHSTNLNFLMQVDNIFDCGKSHFYVFAKGSVKHRIKIYKKEMMEILVFLLIVFLRGVTVKTVLQLKRFLSS